MTFSNLQPNVPQPQPPPPPIVNQVQHPLNQMARFPVVQQTPRMNNPQGNILNQTTRLREPQKFNPSKNLFDLFSFYFSSKAPMNTLSYSQSPATTTTTIDLSQGYSSQQITNPNQNDYSSLQPRYPIQQPSMNLPRQRAPIPTSKSKINFYVYLFSFFKIITHKQHPIIRMILYINWLLEIHHHQQQSILIIHPPVINVCYRLRNFIIQSNINFSSITKNSFVEY
jgi:hypothetical protein